MFKGIEEWPMLRKLLRLLPILIATSALSQDIQINRQNKTIAVTADESVTADAEIAVLAVGYHNYGASQDVAFHDNVRAAERITKAILDAKIPEANIETERLSLGRAEVDEKWTDEMKKERRFQAQQSWHVTAPVSQAQTIVDLCVNAGANEVDDVEWNVTDPMALQAKAGSAALSKARAIADQMAKGLGTKLGELMYASNRAPTAKMWRGMTVQTSSAMMGAADKEPKLKLFPQRVKSDATVYAVFAIE
jgi:uncharacterized protein